MNGLGFANAPNPASGALIEPGFRQLTSGSRGNVAVFRWDRPLHRPACYRDLHTGLMPAPVASLNKTDCPADAKWVNRTRFGLLAALTLTLTACGGGGGSAASAVLPANGGIANQSALGSTLSPASGTIASGYIECDTAANTAAGNHCNNYANFFPAPTVGGTFVFTAIAATASGTPITQQLVNGSSATFPNGAYRAVESAGDVPQILSISGGPFTSPGSALSGAAGSYGNHVSITCVHMGTGNLELQLVGESGAQTLPLGTLAFSSNTTTVNCSASGGITIF